jgi:hypothetical protein
MTAIFRPEGAMEQAGGPWSPGMLQGSATTALMTREVERLSSGARARDRWLHPSYKLLQVRRHLPHPFGGQIVGGEEGFQRQLL